jgi:hypothetical protein
LADFEREALHPHDGKGIVNDEDEEKHAEEARGKRNYHVHDIPIELFHLHKPAVWRTVFYTASLSLSFSLYLTRLLIWTIINLGFLLLKS